MRKVGTNKALGNGESDEAKARKVLFTYRSVSIFVGPDSPTGSAARAEELPGNYWRGENSRSTITSRTERGDIGL
jgi:hypothetical protein